MRVEFQAFIALIYRQLKRFVRSKSRLVNSFTQPILWFVFFGLGWSAAFKLAGPSIRNLFGGVEYLKFLAPGVAMMTVFTASFMSGISVIWDREFGFLKELLVAPASRESIILGRIFGDSIITTMQGFVMLLLLSAMLGILKPLSMLGVTAVMFASSLTFTSLGISIASRMRSMEGFHLLIGFVTMPLLFLSGAFYPISPLPGWLRTLSLVNPLTFSVELARGVYIGVFQLTPPISMAGLITSMTASLTAAILLFRKTYIA